MPAIPSLGAVISQNNKPIAFYSSKFQPAQRQYTTTEHKLFSIIKTFKEFKNILLGQQIVVYIDHKNLTYKNFTMECIMRWRLLIVEFGPPIEYIKGPTNIVANVLSRLDFISSPSNLNNMADCYGIDKDDLPINTLPITYQLINYEQNKYKILLAPTKGVKHYTLKEFHGATDPHNYYIKKIGLWFPKDCKMSHEVVGIIWTKEIISQHFYWKNMRDQITRDVSTCSVCQK